MHRPDNHPDKRAARRPATVPMAGDREICIGERGRLDGGDGGGRYEEANHIVAWYRGT